LSLNAGGFRTCPKCITGMLFLDKDRYGPFVTCRSCGWHKDLSPGKPLPKTSDHDDAPATTDGCRVSTSCFTCPLPDCQYETPSTTRAWLQDQRVLQVFAQYQRLGTVTAVREKAKALNVADRTIYRTLRRNKNALGTDTKEAIA
jgi:hypothetical protein